MLLPPFPDAPPSAPLGTRLMTPVLAILLSIDRVRAADAGQGRRRRRSAELRTALGQPDGSRPHIEVLLRDAPFEPSEQWVVEDAPPLGFGRRGDRVLEHGQRRTGRLAGIEKRLALGDLRQGRHELGDPRCNRRGAHPSRLSRGVPAGRGTSGVVAASVSPLADRPTPSFFEIRKQNGTTQKATTAEYWNTLL